MKTLDSLPPGIDVHRDYREFSIVSCEHDPVHRGALGNGREICTFCLGDEPTTKGWTLPVKLLANVTIDQGALF